MPESVRSPARSRVRHREPHDPQDLRPHAWSEPTYASIDEILARHAQVHDRFETVVREVAVAGGLDETFTDHHGIPQSYGATILQVTWHNTLHRGEVLHMLQRLGVPDLPDGDPQEWEHLTGRI